MPTRYLSKFSSLSEFSRTTPSLNTGSPIGVVNGVLYYNTGTGTQVLGSKFRGATRWVDAVNGRTDGQGGVYSTMAAALAASSPGDFVGIRGLLAEGMVVGPASLTDITIFGETTRPRAGSSNTTGPKIGSAEWTRTAAGDTSALFTVTCQGWKFVNLRFVGPTSYAAVRLHNNGDSTTSDNAGHAEFIGCQFVGPSVYGIEDAGGNINVGVYDCDFFGYETSGNYAIGCSSTANALPRSWKVKNNTFAGNYGDINVPLSASEIVDNHFFRVATVLNGEITNTVAISFLLGSGAIGKNTTVAHNYFDAASNAADSGTRFVDGTACFWVDNICSDKSNYGKPA